MRTGDKLFWALTIGLLILIVGMVCVGYLLGPTYAEGEIVEKYIDTGDHDEFQFVLLESDGSYLVVIVTPEQYYEYEVGDLFAGEVTDVDDPDSWWS